MILRTIKCDLPECESFYTEESENKGFPGWGSLSGLREEKNGEVRETAYLCPGCLKKVIIILNGGNKK